MVMLKSSPCSLQFEADGLLVADQCALVVEAETKILMQTIKQMEEALQKIEQVKQLHVSA